MTTTVISIERFPGDKLSSMVEYQRAEVRTVGNYGKLELEDMCRIASKTPVDIFFSHNCIKYNGYIRTKKLKNGDTTLCEFQVSFRGKKVLLNRLLYHNFIEHVDRDEIVINTCLRKGTCCNIRHLKKIKNPKHTSQYKTKHLTDELVIKICIGLKNKVKISELSKEYDVSRTTISNIKNGKIHSEISSHYI